MPRADLCDFRDAYIVARGAIAVKVPNNARKNKSIAFKNNAPFINWISNQWCTN